MFSPCSRRSSSSFFLLTSPERIINPYLVELDNVSIVRGESRILDRISLKIAEGEHTAILGPNGCGKSTLIKALTRELYPYGGEGTVRVCGLDRWVISQLRSLIGVVTEQRSKFLGSPTGLDLAVSGLIGTYGVTAQYAITPEMWERASQALARVDALRLADQEVDTMSTGEQRRVWIARALISNPRALILDEPSNGLDLKAAHELFGTVQSLALSGVTIILVTHHLEEIVPAIKRVILMSQGEIVADGPRQDVLKTDLLGKIFQVEDATLLRGIDLKLEAHRDAVLSHE